MWVRFSRVGGSILGVFQEGLSWISEVFQEGFGSILQFSNKVWGSILGGFGASFSIYFECLGGSGCQVRPGRCFGRLLDRSWSRLGAVLGPTMDQVTPKLPPKPNPIGVLGRLEGSLERPRSVLEASWCVSKQLQASHTKKDKKLRLSWCSGT